MIGGVAVAEGRRRGGGDYATTQEDCSSASAVAQISRRDSVREEAGRERDARARRKELLRQAAAESGSLPEHAGPAYYRPCAHQRQTTHRPTAAAQTTTAVAARRRRHRPRLLPPWRRQSCAGARCACRLHLLLSRCVACACALCRTGCGCGARQLLHRCPLRTEKRKLPELTCELGLSPPRARTRAEP